MTELDAHGQPPLRYYNRRVVDRKIHEMLGVVKGMVCDGVLADGELESFRRWLVANSEVMTTFPGSVLAQRIVSTFEDGIVTAQERHELYELFCDTVGDGGSETALRANFSTRLPFDDPPPTVIFDGRTFVLTGRFFYGERARCEKAIAERGGVCRRDVVKQPLTLVIGGYGSAAWIQSSFGRKIETAVKYRGTGVPLQIVSEEVWAAALEA